MVPWSIRRAKDLPPKAKLRQMQENTHGLVQLIVAVAPDVPNQTPMPQLSKQMLNACPTTMHIIVRLLLGHQSSILSSYESGLQKHHLGSVRVHNPMWVYLCFN